MIYKKDDFVKSILREMNENKMLHNVDSEQVYSILNKYICVPPMKASDPDVAASLLNTSNQTGMGILKYRNVLFNFKDCCYDLCHIICSASQLLLPGNEHLLNKLLLVGDILATIWNKTSVPWNIDEYSVLYYLYRNGNRSASNNFVEIDTLYEAIKKENSNLDKDAINDAINNLERYKCIILMDGKIKLNEHIIVR